MEEKEEETEEEETRADILRSLLLFSESLCSKI